MPMLLRALTPDQKARFDALRLTIAVVDRLAARLEQTAEIRAPRVAFDLRNRAKLARAESAALWERVDAIAQENRQ